MDPIITNSNRRVRLTKEELLAGYCFPDNPAPLDNDPRIKSPDVILEKRAAGTPINLPIAKPVPSLEKDFQELQQRYNREIGEWKKYEREIAAWKAKVIAVVGQLKNEAEQKQKIQKELEETRAELKRKDEVMRFLKSKLLD